MLVIGHRGANKEAPENSREAYQKAIDGGAIRLELDVFLSKDGHPYINHDDDLRHTTHKEGKITALTKEELKGYRLTNGEQLPSLEEVLRDFLPKTEINIEIKGHDENLAEAVGRLCLATARDDKIIISCFHPEPLIYLSQNFPQLQRACLIGGDNISWPFFALASPLLFMKACKANIIHPIASMVDRNFMDQCRARSWKVFPWVTMKGEDKDKESLWTHLMALGVDGLCTNYPRELTAWLKEAHQHGPRNTPNI